MNKKIIGFALALFALVAVGIAFALYTEPSFSGKGTSTLTVQNPNASATNKTLSGSVCVTIEGVNGGKDWTYDVQYSVGAGRSKTYSIPGIIKYWSNTYCSILND